MYGVAVVEVSECIVVGCVAYGAWLIGVSESRVGAPCVEPSLEYGNGCAGFACVGDCLEVVYSVVDRLLYLVSCEESLPSFV